MEILPCGCIDPLATNYNPSAVYDDGSCIFPTPIVTAPNVFTPNGDNANDQFTIQTMYVEELEIQIFNRWGEVVWESNDPNARWDGTYQGIIVPNGQYNWILETKELINDKKYTFNGYINVMR